MHPDIVVSASLAAEENNTKTASKETKQNKSLENGFDKTNSEGEILKSKFVLLNTTNVSNCLELPDDINKTTTNSHTSNNTFSINNSTSINNIDNNDNDINRDIINGSNTSTQSTGQSNNGYIDEVCPFLKIISPPVPCDTDVNKSDSKTCEINEVVENKELQNEKDGDDEQDTIIDENRLFDEMFDENGHLLVDTKFDKQFTYEIIDPLNQEKKIKVNLDFAKHVQSNNKDINSPRIELVRQNLNGTVDMDAAKNQMIIWKGDIKDYFEKPDGKFSSETYISITFNTGSHSSSAPDNERRGLGVLFDVSNSSNPYLFEYKDKSRYAKFTLDDLKHLAGNDFIFHSADNKSKNYFINNLINKENIILKVKTFITQNGDRQINTFIDDGSGNETLYWSLTNVSKLYGHEDIKDKKIFIDTLSQGSGYTLVRTDNIDTRLDSLRSLIMNS